MAHPHHGSGFPQTAEIILSLPFILGIVIYLFMMIYTNKQGRKWPIYRAFLWVSGSFLSLIAVAGPLAELSHTDFKVHMIGHLLLGMLGPLLMVLGAPVTLFLRSLPIKQARRVTKLFRSKIAELLSHPLVTSTLNIGGLWVLYTTNLYVMMHEYMWLHIVVHLHVFLAGYLFTVSMIYIDPIPHRRSFFSRSIILVLALAAHGILSKYIYYTPPIGVPPYEAEVGGMIMYYGGDAVDLIIIIILCAQWYKATKPRVHRKQKLASI